MSFKDDYYSIEARINNASNSKRIKEIVVEKSTDGCRYESIIGTKYKIVVLPDEYEKATQLARTVNNRKITDKIQEDIEFKYRLEEQDEKFKNFEPRPKKELKSKPKDMGKNKKYKVKEILKRTLAGVVASAVVIGGACFAKHSADEYKEKVASESLSVLKEKLNAEKIWDDSTKVSSSKDIVDIEITGNDGKTYRFYVEGQYGEVVEKVDTIKNPNVVEAVQTVANAQDGNIFEAIKADKLTEKIQEGKEDLKYPGNSEKNVELDEER